MAFKNIASMHKRLITTDLCLNVCYQYAILCISRQLAEHTMNAEDALADCLRSCDLQRDHKNRKFRDKALS